jgi:hypothetical protein
MLLINISSVLVICILVIVALITFNAQRLQAIASVTSILKQRATLYSGWVLYDHPDADTEQILEVVTKALNDDIKNANINSYFITTELVERCAKYALAERRFTLEALAGHLGEPDMEQVTVSDEKSFGGIL